MEIVKVWRRTGSDGRERTYALAASGRFEVEFLVPGSLAWTSIFKSVPGITKGKAGGKQESPDKNSTMEKVRKAITTFCTKPRMVELEPARCSDGEMSVWTLSDQEAASLLRAMTSAMGWDGEIEEMAEEVLSDDQFRDGPGRPVPTVQDDSEPSNGVA